MAVDVAIMSDSGVGRWENGTIPQFISKICNDTRELKKNDCFLAIKTAHRDGHDFLQHAKDNGASCAIVSLYSRDVDLPQYVCDDTEAALTELAKYFRGKYNGSVIAVTGSFGKTTTKEILKLVLGITNNATIDNKNGRLGVPMTLCQLSNSEPFAVIEIGVDTPGTIDQLIDIVRPTIGIVTGITKIHVNSMGSEESIAKEKSKLIAACASNGMTSIFPKDCLRFEPFNRFEKNSIVVGTSKSDVGYDITCENGHYVSIVSFNGGIFRFEMPHVMSLGVAKNFSLAAICSLRCGVSSKSIQDRIRHWEPSDMRGKILEKNGRRYYVDCYNANPASFPDSIENFNRLFNDRRRLFLIGALKMSEVGDGFIGENRKIFQNGAFRSDDTVVLIGECSEEISKNVDNTNIIPVGSTDSARSIVENFSGDVYVKGHRCYKLEQIVI